MTFSNYYCTDFIPCYVGHWWLCSLACVQLVSLCFDKVFLEYQKQMKKKRREKNERQNEKLLQIFADCLCAGPSSKLTRLAFCLDISLFGVWQLTFSQVFSVHAFSSCACVWLSNSSLHTGALRYLIALRNALSPKLFFPGWSIICFNYHLLFYTTACCSSTGTFWYFPTTPVAFSGCMSSW